MTDVIIVPELENEAWPPQFDGAWGNIMISILGNTVLSLYFNNTYSSGTILENNNYLELPDAYISIHPDGEIYEVYVIPPLRGRGIASVLCAWTRTNFINNGLVVKAPNFMADSGKGLYNYISMVYNEPYIEPEGVPMFGVYSDFGGWSLSDIDGKYN